MVEMAYSRQQALDELHDRLRQGENAEQALWQVVIAYQNCTYRTVSGLPFSYQAKRRKDGTYSGELCISRKEGSKTLTKSSVLLALAIVAQHPQEMPWQPAYYKGPKSIGQIFGISYIYSLFWSWGLLQVPQRIEEKLRPAAPAQPSSQNERTHP